MRCEKCLRAVMGSIFCALFPTEMDNIILLDLRAGEL